MENLVGKSNDPDVAAVFAEHTAGADAVIGQSNKGRGVIGRSNGVFGIDHGSAGVLGECKANIGVKGVAETGVGVNGVSKSGYGVAGESETQFGVLGISNTGRGVEGRSNGVFGIDHGSAGVLGECKANIGVKGVTETGVGVNGVSKSGYGVAGESETQFGVLGISNTGAGVEGRSNTGPGVVGKSQAAGVIGESRTWIGVYGESDGGVVGVMGEGKATGDGVKGHASGPGKAAVCGFHLTNQGPGIFGKGAPAGRFEGDVEVTGDIRLTGGDCAEDFDICETVQSEPGTVMVLGAEGVLHPSQQGYDKRVAGVISGAGNYKPGIVLDKHDSQPNRKSIALLGKVYCKVDASYAPIEVGDLLTTSSTPGHAMKADDPHKAFGAVIGKALRPLSEGQGLIPILIALQ